MYFILGTFTHSHIYRVFKKIYEMFYAFSYEVRFIFFVSLTICIQ